ncbi:MAG: ComEC/Rec2 family competence protein, partial [Candidatus Bathyarchaeia archaeon]
MLANYFFLVGASFLLGIVLASITSYWFLFVLSALVFIKIPRLAILTFIFFLLGGAYLIWRTPIISNADSARLLQRREIVVSIVSQGRNRGFYKEFTGIASIDKTPIKILLAIPQFYQIKVGDQLALTGQFELLKEPYHLDRKLQAKFYVKQLTVLKTQTSFTAILARWKQTLTGKLNEKLSLSASQLISGLLYGQDITEPRLRQNLKQAGLSHLTAISGYNLTLIGSLLFEGLKFFPLSAATISLISTVAIIVFALFVGGQASIIRAALMGVLLIGCKSLGRVPLRRNILLVAALLITLAEPQALVVDLGFQLSFLATIGILYLAEPIKQLISHKPEQPNRLKQT